MGGIEVVVDIGVLNNTALAVVATGFVGLFRTTKAACPNACAIGFGVDGGEIGVVGVEVVAELGGSNFKLTRSCIRGFPKPADRFGNGFLELNFTSDFFF